MPVCYHDTYTEFQLMVNFNLNLIYKCSATILNEFSQTI